MKQRKTNKKPLVRFALFLTLLLIGTTGQAKAETDEGVVKLKGDCYYRYENQDELGKGIKIVGIRKGVKNPTIPNRMDGEKVLWIELDGEIAQGEDTIDTLNIPKYVKEYQCITSVEDDFWRRTRPVKVKNYKVHAENQYYRIKAGCLYSKDGKTLEAYPDRRQKESFAIPKGTVEIADYAFVDSQVENVSMPDSVTYIGTDAFFPSKLKSIKLSSKLRRIQFNAFRETNIRKIVFPKTLTWIGDNAFQDCKKLKTVIIPKKNRLITIGSFSGCSQLKEFIYPKPLLSEQEENSLGHGIENEAFRDCISLEKVELPDGLSVIGINCFRNCKNLKKVTIKGDTEICPYAFYGCESLQKVTLSNKKGRVYILKAAFQKCGKLKQIRIASKSKKGNINEEAFVKKGKKKKLTIVAPKDSYAYNYAKKHKKQGLKAKALK